MEDITLNSFHRIKCWRLTRESRGVARPSWETFWSIPGTNTGKDLDAIGAQMAVGIRIVGVQGV